MNPANETDENRIANNAIYVCSLSRVNEIVSKVGASHLVTLINNDTMIDTPQCIEGRNHLRLAMNDISEPAEGLVLPNHSHVTELIEFTEAWNRRAPIVIHCWAGISRSTAAAFISLCVLNPGVREFSIAQVLREASPTAQPNRRLVSIADEILSRDGRMNKAIEDIGRGILTHEGTPFSVSHKMT